MSNFANETNSEAQLRNYIVYQLFYNKGFKRYAFEFKNYYLNFLDDAQRQSMGIDIAAVDAQNKIIYISKAVIDEMQNAESPEQRKDKEDLLSMLLRHELLHGILEHQKRTIIFIAKKLGCNDPTALTKEEYQHVMQVYSSPTLTAGLFTHQNSVSNRFTLSNFAGDYDLSRNYITRDIELSRELGALVIEDHPEWLNKSFEDILQDLENRERRLRLKFLPVVEVDIDTDGNISNEVSMGKMVDTLDNVIQLDDISGVRLPNLAELTKVINNKQDFAFLNFPQSWDTEAVYISTDGYFKADLSEVKIVDRYLHVVLLGIIYGEFTGYKPDANGIYKIQNSDTICYMLSPNSLIFNANPYNKYIAVTAIPESFPQYIKRLKKAVFSNMNESFIMPILEDIHFTDIQIQPDGSVTTPNGTPITGIKTTNLRKNLDPGYNDDGTIDATKALPVPDIDWPTGNSGGNSNGSESNKTNSDADSSAQSDSDQSGSQDTPDVQANGQQSNSAQASSASSSQSASSDSNSNSNNSQDQQSGQTGSENKESEEQQQQSSGNSQNGTESAGKQEGQSGSTQESSNSSQQQNNSDSSQQNQADGQGGSGGDQGDATSSSSNSQQSSSQNQSQQQSQQKFKYDINITYKDRRTGIRYYSPDGFRLEVL